MIALLAVSSVQMQLSPNLWVMINTLQILRTILLLKLNLPISIRKMITSSSIVSSFDFGISSSIMQNPSDDELIIKVLDGDTVLSDYFNEYGIETYRFLDYFASIFFD